MKRLMMNLTLWIVAGLLAVVYLISGGGKLIMPKEKIAALTPSARWVEDFSAGSVKAIGTLEVLAAVGLIVPAAIDIAPVLVPLAAVGLVLVMVGALITHLPPGPEAWEAWTAFEITRAPTREQPLDGARRFADGLSSWLLRQPGAP